MPYDLTAETPPQDIVKFDQELKQIGYRLAREFPYRPEVPLEGSEMTYLGYTMIGLKRMDNLQFCLEEAIREGTPGDFVETGVWRGGACILARAILKAHGVSDKKVWVADSFKGLPAPNTEKYPIDKGDDHYLNPYLRVSLEAVQNNFRKFGLLDDQVDFLEGWFKDSLHKAPIERLCVLRIDGDLFESTMDTLTALYDKVSVNGFIIVDDYLGKGCQQAVNDFRRARGIDDPIVPIDKHGAYWKRTR